MRIPRLNENTTFQRDVTFLNSDRDPIAPTTARYRVDCLTTGTVVRDWTPLPTAESTATITLNQVDNRIVGYAREFEVRQCVVEATDILNQKYVSEFKWEVQDLDGLSSQR